MCRHDHRVVKQLWRCLSELRCGKVVCYTRCVLLCDLKVRVQLSRIKILRANLSRRQELARWLLFAVCGNEFDVDVDVFRKFGAKLVICDVYGLARALARVVLTCLAVLALQ